MAISSAVDCQRDAAAALPGFEAAERQHAQQLDQAMALLVRDED